MNDKMPVRYCIKCGRNLEKKEIEGKKRYCCPDCGWVHYKNPLPSVACVVRKDDCVLLIKRGVAPDIGKWALPSGFLEDDESPVEGCIRELEEETGLHGRVKRLLDVDNEESSIYGNVLVIGYEIEIIGGELRAGSDTLEVKFFPVNNLPLIPFESHLRILKSAIETFTT